MDSGKHPQVAVLGIAEQAAAVREGMLAKLNILGLKTGLPTNLLPCSLEGWNLVLSVRDLRSNADFDIRIKTDSGDEIGRINLYLTGEETPPEPILHSKDMLVSAFDGTWITITTPINDSQVIFPRAGKYTFSIREDDDSETSIGSLYIILVDPPPLTPDRVAAIQVDPLATKAARATYGCKFCSSSLKVYAALDNKPSLEAEGFTWYQNAPDLFTCQCGKQALTHLP